MWAQMRVMFPAEVMFAGPHFFPRAHSVKVLRVLTLGLVFALCLCPGWVWAALPSTQEVPTVAPSAPTGRILVLIDSEVADATDLERQWSAVGEVVRLGPQVAGLAQITALLKSHAALAGLHIVSHGASGQLSLGSETVTLDTLHAHKSELLQWSKALQPGAGIYLYGCEVAIGTKGRDFVTGLAEATGRPIAASTNLTGGAGDWSLEFATSEVDTRQILTALRYDHTLHTLNVGDLVVLGWSALSDTVVLATLVDIPSGTVIKMTDKGWNQGQNKFTTGTTADGVITWTTGSSISAGTVFTLRLGGSDEANILLDVTNNVDRSGNIVSSTYTVTDPIPTTGDGILIYQDSDFNPYFIFGLNNSSGAVNASGWNTGVGAALRDSMLPNGVGSQNALTNGVNAIGFTNQKDNVQYTGPTTATNQATWLARITNAMYWTGDDTGAAAASVGTVPGSSLNVVPPDTTPAAVVMVWSSMADGLYKAGDVLSVLVSFDEPVLVTGTPQLTLETGAIDQVIDYVSGSGTNVLTFSYRVQAGDSSADLDYVATNALGLNGGAIRDAANNNATLTLATPGTANSLGATKSIAIDGVAPFVTSTAPAAGAVSTDTAMAFIAHFSEAVTNISTDDFALETTGSASGAVTGVSASSGTSVTVTVGGIVGNGTIKLNLNGSTNISDAAGNIGPAGYAGGTAHSVAIPSVPGVPTGAVAVAGNAGATVSFSAPANNGGSAITLYTATANPGGATGTCTGPAACAIWVSPLTNGIPYTFTVTATNVAGASLVSDASNAVTPKVNQTITFNDPGAQNFGTTPTLTATTSSGLTVAFTASTPAICTITTGNALTFLAAGTCTVNADQAGDASYLAAPQVSRSFSVIPVLTASGSVPGMAGIATATLNEVGYCTLDPAQTQFISTVAVPGGRSAPYGGFEFRAVGCSSVTLTLAFPEPLPAGVVFWKNGPATPGEAATWFLWSGATLSADRRSVTYTVMDNGVGDADTAVGVVRDPFAPVIGGGDAVAGIPVDSPWALALLTVALGLLAWRMQRQAACV